MRRREGRGGDGKGKRKQNLKKTIARERAEHAREIMLWEQVY